MRQHRLLALAFLLAPPVLAEEVVCHVDYGGERLRLAARPTASPYAVGTTPVGSFFRLRIVFEKRPADTAAIKVYSYAERDDDAPRLVHLGTWAYPPGRAGRDGFTGRQFVYEPETEAELEYWCELRDRGGR